MNRSQTTFLVLAAVGFSAVGLPPLPAARFGAPPAANTSVAPTSLSLPLPPALDSVSVVRRNFVDLYTLPRASRLDRRVAESLDTLEGAVRGLTAPDYLRADGSWADLDYREIPSGGWSPWEHFRRLSLLAKALTTPGQSFFGDPRLRQQAEAALGYVQVFYGPTTLPLGNWWFWTIGPALDLAPTLVLLEGSVDPLLFEKSVRLLRLRIGSGPYSHPIGPAMTGQNLVWSCFTHLGLALVEKNEGLLLEVREAMAAVTSVAAPGTEGLQFDFSFHQHGPQLYTGGYGGGFGNDVAKYILLTRGTTAALPPENGRIFADYVVEGIAWSLHHNYFDVSVIGREVARPSTTGHHGLSALLQMALVPSPRQAEIIRAAKKMLETWNGALPTELAGLAADVERLGGETGWPSGHRHYPASDYTVHRRPGYFASIKMLSSRTKSGERTNQENLLGSRQSDGRLSLTLKGDEYFSPNVWPVFDWTRLPGTTIEQKPDTADSTYGFGRRAFAGGTGDGRNGVSAMEVAPLNSSLTARKSWFFFNDSIVFLTSSISSPTPNTVETVVQQVPLPGTGSGLIVDGSPRILQPATNSKITAPQWLVAGEIGYWFPEPLVLNARREVRSGSWSRLSRSGSAEIVSHEILTLWLDHGTNVSGGKAAYALVPNATGESMQEWAGSRPLSILANSDVAAVRDNRSGDLGLVFWTPGTIEGIESDVPAVVYLTTVQNGLQLSVADPSQQSPFVAITVPGAFRIESSSAIATATPGPRSTTVRIAVQKGATATVRLARTKQRAIKR